MKNLFSFALLGLLLVGGSSACIVNGQDCANGATCHTNVDSGNSCECPPGYSGQLCQNSNDSGDTTTLPPTPAATNPPPTPAPTNPPPTPAPTNPPPTPDATPAPTPAPPANDPCTAENIGMHRFYHPFPANERKYIQCDQWGGKWVKPCAPGTKWYQPWTTCIHA